MKAVGVRVLVVDENPLEQRMLREWGEQLGWQMDEAVALDALAAWSSAIGPTDCGCVLLSLSWDPQKALSALEMCRMVREELAVIVLAGEESAEVLVHAWRAGADAILGKRQLSKASVQRAVGRLVAGARGSQDGLAHGEQPLRVLQVACHDLRNPLSAMMINANLLLRGENMPDERRAKTVNRILASVRRMNRMIEDLSDYTQVAGGKESPLRPGDADLLAIASEVVEQTRLVYPGHALVLEPRGELRGCWDLPRLRQALSNLLDSALKRGRPGSTVVLGCAEIGSPPEVEIRIEYRPSPDGVEGLSAAMGVGAAESSAALYVARRIVEAHLGSFTATASADGPTFLIRLPKRTRIAAAPVG